MEKSDFDRLLQRYLSGEVTDSERIKIEAWLDVMKGQKAELQEFTKEDEDRLFAKITDNLSNTQDVIRVTPYHANNSLRWVLAAAVFVMTLTATYFLWYSANGKSVEHNILAMVPIEKQLLNDGSIVWLRQGSKLKYYEKKGEPTRHVSLTGEALFEIAKDSSHPFTIDCGEVTAKVVGTSFNIRTSQNGLELEVLTGKVNLSSRANYYGVDVVRNERASYSKSGVVEKKALQAEEIAFITASTEYNMQFNSTSMNEVFRRIEKKFGVNLVIENRQLEKCRITADFTDHSLDKTFTMLSELLGLEYKITGASVSVAGKGCN